MFDSHDSVIEHRKKVEENGRLLAKELLVRCHKHDESKLGDYEKPIFDTSNLKEKGIEFGTEEYFKERNKIDDAIQHHYKENRHHPEHFPNGVDDMNLIDVLEMLCDWKAACKITKNGNINDSLECCRKRFKISDQLFKIMKNTVKDFDLD